LPKKVKAGLDTISPKEPFSHMEGEQLLKSPRGRPCEIRDEQLEISYKVLLGCLETYWHEIGLKLSTAKTSRNVRNVLADFFQGHKSFYRFPFDLETEKPTTPSHPRYLRRRYRQKSLEVESFRKEYDENRKQVEEGRKALSQAENNPETHEIISEELKKREARFKACAAQFKEMEQSLERLRIDLHKQEAFFAESEIFRFIRNPDRGVTPLSLAKAIAGLPYIGCEQSFRRCARFRDETRPSYINYLVFKAIRYIVTHWGFPSSPDKVTELFKTKIHSLPKNYNEARDYLKKHWPYLKEGIEHSCGS
jgi:hypothetical protein